MPPVKEKRSFLLAARKKRIKKREKIKQNNLLLIKYEIVTLIDRYGLQVNSYFPDGLHHP